MLTAITDYVHENLHLMLVHFPIALLFTGVTLDWLGYWLGRPSVTRFGFYILALGILGAVASALVGPDPDPDVPMALFAWHTLFALATVTLGLALVAVRFSAAQGLHGRAAYAYLAGTLALLASVGATGYFGGRMLDAGAGSVPLAVPLLPAKALIVVLCLLAAGALALWLSSGRRFAPHLYAVWLQALQGAVVDRGTLWTLQRAGRDERGVAAAIPDGSDAERYSPASLRP